MKYAKGITSAAFLAVVLVSSSGFTTEPATTNTDAVIVVDVAGGRLG